MDSTPGTWPNIAITLRRSFRGQYRLYLKLVKCEFHCSTVQFHGYIVGQEGIHMDQGKVTAITEWTIPQSIKELQRFLGFAHFYRRFIKDFSLHTAYWNYFLPWDEYAQNSLRQNTSGLTPFQCILGYQPPFFPWMGEPTEVPAVDYWFRERECATRLTSTSSGQCGDIRASRMPGVSKLPSISQETRYGCPPRICVSACPIVSWVLATFGISTRLPTSSNYHPGIAFNPRSMFPSWNPSILPLQNLTSQTSRLLQRSWTNHPFTKLRTSWNCGDGAAGSST